MSILQNLRIKMRIYYVSSFRVVAGNWVLINSWIGAYFTGQGEINGNEPWYT